jgi:hypothetical protein
MYIDDVIGVCFAAEVESDLSYTRGICTSLLGSGAVADDKTEHGVRLDIIGYTVCLPTMRGPDCQQELSDGPAQIYQH